jgi:DNA-binding NtrC family response regulator
MAEAIDEPSDTQPDGELRTVLLIDAEVAVRAPLAIYLRDCGLTVIEAGTTAEAKTVLLESDIQIDVVLCDAAAVGTEAGFAFSRWMKSRFPAVPVLLAGSLQKAASMAGDICEEGPSLAKPYDLNTVLDAMRRAMASKRRAPGAKT